jgi:hypothetical protein
MRFLIALLLVVDLPLTPAFAAGAPRNYDQLAARIDHYSNLYLRRKPKFIEDPLGEGQGYDSDPLFRFDAFDGPSYVNTVLASALTGTLVDFELLMNRLRYKNGEVDFFKRNHFISADWIPNNTKDGFIRDATADVLSPGGDCAELLKTPIDRKGWYKKMHNLDVDAEFTAPVLPYITREALLTLPSLRARIPNGAVVNFLRDGRHMRPLIGTELEVQQQSFVIRKKDGRLVLRHARSRNFGILEEDFVEFLWSQPQILGVNILAAVPQKIARRQ